jgi:hypothetical protein
VQDTTGSSFNVFANVLDTSQVGCFAHTQTLVDKWSVQNVPFISDLFDRARSINSVISASNKRIAAVTDKAKLGPRVVAATRWGSNVVTMERTLNILDHLLVINWSSLFDQKSVVIKTKLVDDIQCISDNRILLQALLGFQRTNIAWVQCLSSNSDCTASLVRCAIRDMSKKCKILRESHTTTSIVSQKDKILNAHITEYCDSFEFQLDNYYFKNGTLDSDSDSFFNFWIFRSAEFLDPRFLFSLTREELVIVKDDIIDFFKERVARETHDLAPAPASVTPPQPTTTAVIPLHLQQLLTCNAISQAANETNEQKVIAQIRKEIEEYVVLVTNELVKTTLWTTAGKFDMDDWCPLKWWSRNNSKFPLLSVIASILLAVPAESAGVERQFSIARRILTWCRAGLSGETVNMLTLLNQWLRNELGLTDKRQHGRSEALFLKVAVAIDQVTTKSDDSDILMPIVEDDKEVASVSSNTINDEPEETEDIGEDEDSIEVALMVGLEAEQIQRNKAQEREIVDRELTANNYRTGRSSGGRMIRTPKHLSDYVIE